MTYWEIKRSTSHNPQEFLLPPKKNYSIDIENSEDLHSPKCDCPSWMIFLSKISYHKSLILSALDVLKVRVPLKGDGCIPDDDDTS